MYANPNLINKTQPRKTFLCSRKVKILIRNMQKICFCFHFPLFARIPNTTPQLGGKTKPANLKLRAAGKQKPRSWYKVNMRRANKHIPHSAIPATCKHVELLRVMGLLHFSGVPPHFYTTLFYSILDIFVTFQFFTIFYNLLKTFKCFHIVIHHILPSYIWLHRAEIGRHFIILWVLLDFISLFHCCC